MSELTTLFKNTADAIRSKTGDAATIQASQFPAKIQGISVGISQDEADARYLQLSGGTMTGDLILNGAPTADNQAATKAYVDEKSGGWNVGGSIDFTNPLNTTETLKIPLNNLPRTAKSFAISLTMTQSGKMPGKSFYLSIGTSGNYRPITGSYLSDKGGSQTICSPLVIDSIDLSGISGFGYAANVLERYSSKSSDNTLEVKLYGEYYSGVQASGTIELLYM